MKLISTAAILELTSRICMYRLTYICKKKNAIVNSHGKHLVSPAYDLFSHKVQQETEQHQPTPTQTWCSVASGATPGTKATEKASTSNSLLSNAPDTITPMLDFNGLTDGQPPFSFQCKNEIILEPYLISQQENLVSMICFNYLFMPKQETKRHRIMRTPQY